MLKAWATHREPELKLDLPRTRIRVERLLREQLCFLHYQSLYDECAVHVVGKYYSISTSGAEKLRDNLSTKKRYIVRNGHVALTEWFSTVLPGRWLPILRHEYPAAVLSEEQRTKVIMENQRRWLHMKDHFHDARSLRRQEKRIEGSLIEASVALLFKQRYPHYFLPATNEDDYERPAVDDFRLLVPWVDNPYLVDVKNFPKEHVDPALRSPHNGVIYIFATWREEESKAVINGFYVHKCQIPFCRIRGNFGSVPYHSLHPIENLMVWLNMKNGSLYNHFLAYARHVFGHVC